MSNNPARVFVFCDNLIGDFLMQSAGLRGIKSKWPAAELIYCTPEDSVSLDLVHNFPGIDRVMTRVRGEMLRGKGDLWFNASCVEAHSYAVSRHMTMTEAYCHLWGVPCDGVHYSLNVPDSYKERAQQIAGDWGPFAICARHSSSCAGNDPRTGYTPNKCFPNTKWMALCDEFKAHGILPVAVGGPRDTEDVRFSQWPGEQLYGQPIMLVAALQQLAVLTVSVDTGIRHMAAAVGGNLYTVSGATSTDIVKCVAQPGNSKQFVLERVIPPFSVRSEDLVSDVRGALKTIGQWS